MTTKQKEVRKLPNATKTELVAALEQERAYSRILECNFETEVQKRMDLSIQDQISDGIKSGIAAEITWLKIQFNDEVESRVSSRMADFMIVSSTDYNTDVGEGTIFSQ